MIVAIGLLNRPVVGGYGSFSGLSRNCGPPGAFGWQGGGGTAKGVYTWGRREPVRRGRRVERVVMQRIQLAPEYVVKNGDEKRDEGAVADDSQAREASPKITVAEATRNHELPARHAEGWKTERRVRTPTSRRMRGENTHYT